MRFCRKLINVSDLCLIGNSIENDQFVRVSQDSSLIKAVGHRVRETGIEVVSREPE